MKVIYCSFILLTVLVCTDLHSQEFKVKEGPITKMDGSNTTNTYMGMDENNIYFFSEHTNSVFKNTILCFNKQTLTLTSKVKLKFSDRKEYCSSAYMEGGKIKVYTARVRTSRQYIYNYYELDPIASTLVKKVKDPSDTIVKYKSQINESVQIKGKHVFYTSTNSSFYYSQSILRDMMKNPFYERDSINLYENNFRSVYTFDFNYILDKKIPYFGRVINNPKIINHSSLQSSNFNIDKSKFMLEINVIDSSEMGLIIVGKYLEKLQSISKFGFFYQKLSSDLKPLGDIIYTELLSISSDTLSLDNQQYFTLLKTPLCYYRCRFITEENHLLLMTEEQSQGWFNNSYIRSSTTEKLTTVNSMELLYTRKNIYLLHFKPNGKASFNTVFLEHSAGYSTNRLSFKCDVQNNKLYLMFYDNMNNLSKAISDRDISQLRLDRNIIMVSCIYDLETETLGNKKSLEIPNLKKFKGDMQNVIFYLDSTNKIHWIVYAEDDYRKNVILNEFYVD
jgi:hypothetical protein